MSLIIRLGCPGTSVASASPSENALDTRFWAPHRIAGIHRLRCPCPRGFPGLQRITRDDILTYTHRRRPVSGTVGLSSALGRREERLFGVLALNRSRLPSRQRRPPYVQPLVGGEDGVEQSMRLSYFDERSRFCGAFGSGG